MTEQPMTEQPSSPNVSLNVTNIADAVKTIDHACENGAFRGWHDIRQVLALRDRLEAFVNAATAQVNTATEASFVE